MRKTILSFCIGALTLAGWISVSADSHYLPTVSKDGKKCYYYSVDKGESVYGIISRFGWDADTFMLYNPSSVELKKGQVVYYPCETEESNKKDMTAVADSGDLNIQSDRESVASAIKDVSPKSKAISAVDELAIPLEQYRVADGDTYLSIIDRHKTSASRLFQDNPGLTPDNLSAGLLIKVRPGSNMANVELKDVVEKIQVSSKKYKAKQGDTWVSLSAVYNLDTATLKANNPNVPVLKKGTHITIPVFKDTVVPKMLPVVDSRQQTDSGIRSIYEDVHKLNQYRQERKTCITVLVGTDAASKKREIDFLRGFMLGMDGVVSTPDRVTLRAIEIEDSEALNKAIYSGALKGTDMLVCATDKDFPAELAGYCDDNNILLLNVFDAKTDVSRMTPVGVQLLPSSDYFYNRIADFLTRVLSDRIYIYIGGNVTDNESLSAAILDRLRATDASKLVVLEDASALETYDFQPALSYAVISDAGSKEDIGATMTALEKIVDKYPKMPLTLIGRPNWMVYAKPLEALLRKLDTYIPSRFMFDDDTPQSKQLEKDYYAFYKDTPVKSMPSYVAMGFDVARYFVSQYLAADSDLNYAKPAEAMVQLDFRLERADMWSGFVNKCVYLLHFTPFSTTDKIRL